VSEDISLSYRFYSTGELETLDSRAGQSIDPVHRLFSRFLGSVRQLGMNGESLLQGTVDFRLVYIPPTNGNTTQPPVECVLTFCFRLPGDAEPNSSEREELVQFCESVLTFTFRQHNFTIERIDGPAPFSTRVGYIIEVLRPIDTGGGHSKIVPESFKTSLHIRKLANLFVRYGRPIGYSVMVDLHGLSVDERALVVQAGIQAQDPLAKLGEHFALPLAPDDPETPDSVVKPVCKLRLFAETEPSSFFISELLECITPNFPRTVSCTRSDEKGGSLFDSEASALERLMVRADSPIQFAPTMQPLMRKVYRSLGIDEIANIAPFPRQPVPGIIHKRYRSFIPPISDLSADGIVAGSVRTEASVDANEVRLPFKDRLRHTYVLGKTGTGKSSFLASLVIQDIMSNHGVVVMDPHGDLCDDVIAALPEACLDRVILIDPALAATYPGCNLNVLDVREGATTAAAIAQAKDYWTGELTSMFLSLYGGEAFGPRIQEYFQAACLTLMDPNVNGTLVDVPRLFTDASFRQKCRESISDQYAAEFWQVFDATGGREQQEMIPYFSSKFSPLVRSYLVRNFVGEASSGLRIPDYLNSGSAVLIRLSKGVMGEMQMRLVGMLLLAKIKAVVFSRQTQEEALRRPVMFYADEFQNFVFEGFQTLLSEARKYGLGLILAHQYLAQMMQSRFQLYGSGGGLGLLDAILGNVGSMIFFRLGAQDAEQVVTHIGEPVEARDLINLESYEFIARVLNAGILSAPMTVSAHRHGLLQYSTDHSELKARIEFIMERFR
jgi:hypothetical protein